MMDAFNHWKENKLPVIDELSIPYGHVVLRSPEYHSELQPIEYLWAYVKSKAAQKYKLETTLEMVQQNLREAFDMANQHEILIGNLIRHTNSKIEKLYKQFNEDEGNQNVSFQTIDEEINTAIEEFLQSLFSSPL